MSQIQSSSHSLSASLTRLLATALLAALFTAPLTAETPRLCAALTIDALGAKALQTLQDSPGIDLWAEMDDVLFVCGDLRSVDSERIEALWTDLEPQNLFIVRGAHPGVFAEHAAAAGDAFDVLAEGGPFSMIRANDAATQKALAAGDLPKADDHQGCKKALVQPFDRNLVLARQSANSARFGGTVFGPAAANAVAAIDGDRWFSDIETLAAWNRHTRGSEIALARDWLVAQFSALPGLAVTTESFQVGATTAYNVIARLDGTTRADEWLIVGAHYDATSQNTNIDAPGAEDNASGCAGVLELARGITATTPETTIFFICYSGEEQGLFGSADHASSLVSQGDASKVVLMLNMDMIGYSGDADLDSLLETEDEFASHLDIFVDAAAEFTTLRTLTSLFAFGSDHVPYINRGIPALLTIQNDWDSYPDYHRTTDLPGNIVLDMGEQTLRMNAAVLAQLAGSGADLIFADGFESGDTSAWTATP